RKEGSAAIADAAIASGVVRVVQESVSMIIPTGEKSGLAKNARPTVSRWPNRIWLQGPGANRFSAAGGAGVVLRFGWLYEPGARHSEEFFAMARRHIAIMMGSANSYVSSIHVAGTAVVAALAVPAGTYNIVDNEPLTKRRHADALSAAAGEA